MVRCSVGGVVWLRFSYYAAAVHRRVTCIIVFVAYYYGCGCEAGGSGSGRCTALGTLSFLAQSRGQRMN